VYALRTTSGRLLWSRPGGVYGTRLAHGEVYAATSYGDVYMWNARTGHKGGYHLTVGTVMMVDAKRMYTFYNEYVAAHDTRSCVATGPGLPCNRSRWSRYAGQIGQPALVQGTLLPIATTSRRPEGGQPRSPGPAAC
jgi:hypothetical protein